MENFNRTFQTPFSSYVPNDIDNHIKQISFYKRYLKFLRRYLYIYLTGQKTNELYAILPRHKNILWINMSAPSLGDSLMDLSSRILLEGKHVDLFTDTKNSNLYEYDSIFKNIYVDTKSISKSVYDLIIIDSYSTRSMKIKSIVAPKTPYVGMFGYFNGPEVNRTLFSFYQMNNLLGNINSEKKIKEKSRNTISISKNDEELVQNIIPEVFISFVLGGEWSYRTYSKWEEVVLRISSENSKLKIVFLGSYNAKNIANQILSELPHAHIYNFVDKLTFKQSTEVMRKSKVVFCCDGGLMHSANAVHAKTISLFARKEPKILLTGNEDSINLYDDTDVNNILSEKILSKFNEINVF